MGGEPTMNWLKFKRLLGIETITEDTLWGTVKQLGRSIREIPTVVKYWLGWYRT